MTDRELLELAAKAAGNGAEWDGDGFVVPVPFKHGLINYEAWNPLTDDGDALRLAVKLGIDLAFGISSIHAVEVETESAAYESFGDDKYAATRRAIVRTATEIGREAK